jgi:bacteriocin-like protein
MSENKKKVLNDLKKTAEKATDKDKSLDVEKELTEKDMESVSGGCLCKCGLAYDCGGGGGGQI